MKLSKYDYFLPPHLIAKHPKPSRLLVFDRNKDEIIDANFTDLARFIPPQTTIFINKTRVIKARLRGHKKSGAKTELLYLSSPNETTHQVQIKGSVKVADELHFGKLRTIIKKLNQDGTRLVECFADNTLLNKQMLLDFLDTHALMPLPPYIKREETKKDEQDYQSVFAQDLGSVAAPTASLHFTKEHINALQKDFNFREITLHVGMGTFSNIKQEDLHLHKMHKEFYHAPQNSIDDIFSSKKILAIGTTVARTIEHIFRTHDPSNWCDLFLNPQNPPKRIDALLTNFHLPKSSLLILVASMLGLETTKRIYTHAIKNEYRFFSYGDCMLIL